MPSILFSNAYLAVNGTDLSSYVQSATLTYESEDLDATAMSTYAGRVHKGGLKDPNLEATFFQGYGAGTPNGVLFGIIGTTACVELRPQNACSSANNPIYSGVFTPLTFTPVGGGVGELLMTTVRFAASGQLSQASSS